MNRRARAIGFEHAESERQMNDINESLRRQDQRYRLATEIAKESYASDVIEIVESVFDGGWFVETVDGGFWVEVVENESRSSVVAKFRIRDVLTHGASHAQAGEA